MSLVDDPRDTCKVYKPVNNDAWCKVIVTSQVDWMRYMFANFGNGAGTTWELYQIANRAFKPQQNHLQSTLVHQTHLRMLWDTYNPDAVLKSLYES